MISMIHSSAANPHIAIRAPLHDLGSMRGTSGSRQDVPPGRGDGLPELTSGAYSSSVCDIHRDGVPAGGAGRERIVRGFGLDVALGIGGPDPQPMPSGPR